MIHENSSGIFPTLLTSFSILLQNALCAICFLWWLSSVTNISPMFSLWLLLGKGSHHWKSNLWDNFTNLIILAISFACSVAPGTLKEPPSWKSFYRNHKKTKLQTQSLGQWANLIYLRVNNQQDALTRRYMEIVSRIHNNGAVFFWHWRAGEGSKKSI